MSRSTTAGFVDVDRVSRTSARGVYAAGDCTGVLMLASVAAMQGRIAMWHALGDAVAPLDLKTVSSNVFTDPEIATVGVTQADVDAGRVDGAGRQAAAGDQRAGQDAGHPTTASSSCSRCTGTRIVVGGVVVAPRASELIFPIALAVAAAAHRRPDLGHTFTVYPSLSGSIAEAARRLHSTA